MMAVMAGLAAVMLAAGSVAADVFNMSGGLKSLDFVTVGNPSNAPDTQVAWNGATGYGQVNYAYNIGKYDVTTAQYTAFLNAVAQTDPYGLYNSGMGNQGYASWCGIYRSGSPGNYTYSTWLNGNLPVNSVTWGAAARFCNWLTNSQPNGAEGAGTTETGLYTLNGATTNGALMAITRNAGTGYAVPTLNEWYKAAYYKGGGTNAGYWLYPTQSNNAPINTLPDTGNHANFYDAYGTGNHSYTKYGSLTPVGDFGLTPGPYGTFDQGGDVFQWTEESIKYSPQDTIGSYRGLRGGSWYDDVTALEFGRQNFDYPTIESNRYGFRVVEVPEPVTMGLMLMGAGVLLRRRGRGCVD
jgi:formylglycine-generating enzyme required for sulfatase activity